MICKTNKHDKYINLDITENILSLYIIDHLKGTWPRNLEPEKYSAQSWKVYRVFSELKIIQT